MQAPQDPRYAAVIATCKTPPPAPGAAPGGSARAAGAPAQGAPGQGGAAGQGPGAAAAPPAGPAEYAVTAVPGVIASGQRWTLVYQTTGNNADGIIATSDGGL